MVAVTFVAPDGSTRALEGVAGETVMELAMANDIPQVLADCGGAMSCATCHVYVAPDWLRVTGGAEGDEVDMLEMALDPNETSRLSCQIRLTDAMDGLVINLPARQF